MVFWKKDANSSSGNWKDRIRLVFQEGGPGFCHFAITNLCDAHCEFCNFAVGHLKAKDIKSVELDEGLKAIDILYSNGIRYIIFVGGEPLLHKNILSFIEHAHKKGMNTLICTNGGRLTSELISQLKEAGLDSMIISIDAPSIEIHEQNRGLKGVCKKIREANKLLKDLNIQTTASVTISKLIEDYDAFPNFLKELGFSNVTFSYPLEYLPSSYLGFADSHLVQFTEDELFEIFEKLKKLRKKFHLVNNTVSLTEMQRFLRKEKQIFPCLGGYRYFYLDWNLDIYRCHYWKHSMCSIYEFGPDKFIRDNCTKCMIDCYRDPSVLQHIAVSLTDAYQLTKEGKYWKATKCLIKKTNFLALRAVIEQLRWIIKI